ncbi:hypothetical protein PENTCL1PPCAC_24426, partial [Pristionchus entomophagus]
FSLLLSSAFSICAASVDFTHSTLYDTKDFVGQKEVHLTQCDNGCLIFASTMGDGFDETPTNYDPYAENLIIYYGKENRNYSITELSRNFDAKTSLKTPLTIEAPAKISVMNINSPTDASFPIVLYVVDLTEAKKILHEVYDARAWPATMIANPLAVTTVMCACPFSLTEKKSGSSNGVTARLVGFENAMDGNIDDCPAPFSLPTQNPFDGLTLNINGPIISLIFTGASGVKLDASLQFIPAFDLSDPGFITSGGYNGCKKPSSGGVQSFRSTLILNSDIYYLDSNTNSYNVTIDVEPNLDGNHKLTLNDIGNNKIETINGYTEVSKQFDNSDSIQVVYNNFAGDQGFLLRYSAVAIPKTTTPGKPISALSTSPMTTPTQTPTTSGSYQSEKTVLSAVVVFALSRLA